MTSPQGKGKSRVVCFSQEHCTTAGFCVQEKIRVLPRGEPSCAATATRRDCLGTKKFFYLTLTNQLRR